jgi:hypothetical protein
MPYFTIQEILPNIIPEMNVNEVSKDNTCVRSLLEETNDNSILQGKEFEKTVLEVVSTPNNIEAKETVETEQRERDVIDCTHTYNLTTTVKLLEEEADNILNAVPCEEPDRSKPIRERHTEYASKHKKCLDCGKTDPSNPYRVWCPHGKGERTRQDTCILEGES